MGQGGRRPVQIVWSKEIGVERASLYGAQSNHVIGPIILVAT